jgi:hypothetical protein
MPANRKPDHDTFRGTAAALQQTFNGHVNGNAIGGDHIGAQAADADFAALLAQLNDPPKQYRSDTQ